MVTHPTSRSRYIEYGSKCLGYNFFAFHFFCHLVLHLFVFSFLILLPFCHSGARAWIWSRPGKSKSVILPARESFVCHFFRIVFACFSHFVFIVFRIFLFLRFGVILFAFILHFLHFQAILSISFAFPKPSQTTMTIKCKSK